MKDIIRLKKGKSLQDFMTEGRKAVHDDDLPYLTQREYDSLYQTMGGAQTNAFIEEEVWTKLRKDQLPGGATIPSPTYLELEPGTQRWIEGGRKEVETTIEGHVLGSDGIKKWWRGRGWEEEVARAKVLNSAMSEQCTIRKTQMRHMRRPSVCRKESGTDRVAKLKKIRETARDTVLTNTTGVYNICSTL